MGQQTELLIKEDHALEGCISFAHVKYWKRNSEHPTIHSILQNCSVFLASCSWFTFLDWCLVFLDDIFCCLLLILHAKSTIQSSHKITPFTQSAFELDSESDLTILQAFDPIHSHNESTSNDT